MQSHDGWPAALAPAARGCASHLRAFPRSSAICLDPYSSARTAGDAREGVLGLWAAIVGGISIHAKAAVCVCSPSIRGRDSPGVDAPSTRHRTLEARMPASCTEKAADGASLCWIGRHAAKTSGRRSAVSSLKPGHAHGPKAALRGWC